MDIKFIPLTFINTNEEILKQIKNSVLFSFLLSTHEETTLEYYLESTQYGYTASALENGKHKLVRITDINNGTVDWGKVPFCDCDAEDRYLLKDNDILVARTGGTTGKSFFVNNPPSNAVFASYLIRLRLKENIDVEFMNCFLNSYLFWSQIIEMKSGSAMPNVNAEKLKTLRLPKCDLKTQKQITTIFQSKENNPTYKNLFKKINSVERLFNNSSSISTELNHQLTLIKKLRQQLLQEAVQGKLLKNISVQQNIAYPPDKSGGNSNRGSLFKDKLSLSSFVNDESNNMPKNKLHQSNNQPKAELPPALAGGTGKELLEQIKTEKALLIKEKKIKADRELPPIQEEEIPFAIPENWTWCRLGEIIELISGQHIDASDYNENGTGLPYLTGPSDFGNVHPIPTRWTSKPKVIAKLNDILITVKGSGVGKTNVNHLDKIVISRQLMAIRVQFIEKDYIHIFLQSSFDELQAEKKGTGIPGISRENITERLFPLPPLAEQQRIVAKLEELMQTCSELEASVKQSVAYNERLLQQVLREALQPK